MEDVITIAANLSTKGFEKGTKDIVRAVKSLSNTAKSFGRSMIASIVGVGSVIGILTKAIGTYMSQNEELSQRMNAIWTALGNVLGPIIEQIIEWVSTAVSYFLGFLKLLGITGKSASELSKAAKKNTQELQKTILGFDELNVLQDNTQQDKSNPLRDIEPSDFMKTLADLLKNKMWDDAADLIIQKMNDLIYAFRDKAYELGDKIGEYLGGALHVIGRVLDEVDWHALGEGLANLVNGIFDNPNMNGEDLGKILVAKFTIAFKILTGFLETVNLGKIGEYISDAIKGALDSISSAIDQADFRAIGENISNFITNIDVSGIINSLFHIMSQAFKGAAELIQGVDWFNIGEKIIEWIRNIKLGDITASLMELQGSIFGAVVELLAGAVIEIGKWLKEKFNALGNMTFEGLAEGIKNAFLDIGTWIKENIFDPFINGFKKVFVINSPSEVMAELGRYIIEGLINGIKELLPNLSELKDEVAERWNGIKEAVTNAVDTGKDKIASWWDAINPFREANEEATTAAEELGEAIVGAGEAMEESAEKYEEGGKAYSEASKVVADSSKEAADVVTESTQEIRDKTAENTEEANRAATTNAETMNANVTGAYSELEGEAASRSENIADVTDLAFQRVADNAWVWGSDMVANFIDGIDAQIPALEAELQYIANMIAAYIHFTKPDKGPLADFDTYGPDMIKEFISGMEGEKSNLEKAIGDIADTISFQMPTVAGGGFLPYNVSQSSSASTGTDLTQIVERFLSALDSFEESIQNMQLVAQFGNLRLLAEGITREQRRIDRSEGR